MKGSNWITGAIALACAAVAAPTAVLADHKGHAVQDSANPMATTQTEVSPLGRKADRSTITFIDQDPPLWDGLGGASYRITTKSAEAQRYFDQGLQLAYAFNHIEAQRAFRKAQRLDPDCAMCFWGEALVLGPNINMPMAEEAVAPAFKAVSRARALADRAAPHEQALIAALAKRYADDPAGDRAALDKAYAAAMERVAARFPDDNEIQTLFAEALMDVSPWSYWQSGGREPNPQVAALVPTLERVLARDPDHVGAIHLYIHAVEASSRPERAEPYADRLSGTTPDAGHLLHMPSHIYYRVGRYGDALEANLAAAAADERYIAKVDPPAGVYRLGYYPHNVHFVLVSAQMSGDGPTVIAAAEKLDSLIPDDAAAAIALIQPVKAAPYFAHAQFSPPKTVLALPAPGDGIPYVKAMWHYARGIAQVGKGDFAAAAAEAKAIAGIRESADFAQLTAGGIPASDVLKIAEHVVHARILQARADYAGAIESFAQAARLQDTLAYMEPPYWYYPVRLSLGAAMVQAGRLEEAEEQFRLSLERAPNNAWAYFGLLELYRTRGDAKREKRARDALEAAWTGDRALLQLSRL